MTVDLSELRSKRGVKKKEAKNVVVVQVGTEEGGRIQNGQVLTCAVGYEDLILIRTNEEKRKLGGLLMVEGKGERGPRE